MLMESCSIESFYYLRYGKIENLRIFINSLDFQNCQFTEEAIKITEEKIRLYRSQIERLDAKSSKRHDYLPKCITAVIFWVFSICILPSLNWTIDWNYFAEAHKDLGLVFMELALWPVILILSALPIMLPYVIIDNIIRVFEKFTIKKPELILDYDIADFLSQGIRNLDHKGSINLRQEYETFVNEKYYGNECNEIIQVLYTYCALFSLVLGIVMLMNSTSVSYMFHDFARWFLIIIASILTILFIIAKNPFFTATAGAALMFIPGLVDIDHSIWSVYDIIIGFVCLFIWKSKLCLFNITLLFKYDTRYKFVIDLDAFPLFLQIEKIKEQND